MNQVLTPPPEALETPEAPADTLPAGSPVPLSADEFAALDGILSYLRSRSSAIPVWEFCEGFMAALICCRRPIDANEYIPVLVTVQFANAVQRRHFMSLWRRRWHQVMLALDTKVAALDDPAAYQPEVKDARAAYAALPEDARAALQGKHIPSFGQVWAQGFMAATRAWPLEWAPPRNKEAATWRNAAVEVVERLTQDDLEPPTLHAFEDDGGAPTVSLERMNAFADAIWAVYNMREMWRSLGPRIETVHQTATPGRNDPCSCGSGKKYKKCCSK
ncbi:MAG TPA: UPF0149 family protein [Rhodoferax sp.]